MGLPTFMKEKAKSIWDKTGIELIHPDSRFHMFLLAWIELFEAIIQVVSFGFLMPRWSWDFVCWSAKEMARKKREEHHREDLPLGVS